MRKLTLIFIITVVSILPPATCQTPSTKYQLGTIMAVTRHKDASANQSEIVQYDVSVKVDNTVYVGFYTPPNGGNQVEYAAGLQRPVLVKTDSLIFQSGVNGTLELPILSRETLPAQPAIDLARAPGEYFTMKVQNLTASLNLNEEQQSQIKPIAEQESAQVGSVCFTPTIPRKERLKRWEKIVHSSDARMKPILSQTQWAKLRDLRKDQKEEFKKMVAQEN
jgi:hypothetical protein